MPTVDALGQLTALGVPEAELVLQAREFAMRFDGSFHLPQLDAWRAAARSGRPRLRSVHAPHMSEAHAQSRRLRLAYLARTVELCAELGSGVLVVHGQHLFADYEGTLAFLRGDAASFAEVLLPGARDVLDRAAAADLLVGLENERVWADPRDGGYLNTPANLLRCVQAFDHRAVGVTLDLCHAYLAGTLESFVADAAPHVVSVHASDVAGRARRAPGEGVLDWEALLDAFVAMPRLRALTLELEGGSSPAAVGGSVGFLRRLLDRRTA